MTNATDNRRSLFVAYSFKELESMMTQGKERAAGTTDESSHLVPQVGGREGTLGMAWIL